MFNQFEKYLKLYLIDGAEVVFGEIIKHFTKKRKLSSFMNQNGKDFSEGNFINLHGQFIILCSFLKIRRKKPPLPSRKRFFLSSFDPKIATIFENYCKQNFKAKHDQYSSTCTSFFPANGTPCM